MSISSGPSRRSRSASAPVFVERALVSATRREVATRSARRIRAASESPQRAREVFADGAEVPLHQLYIVAAERAEAGAPFLAEAEEDLPRARVHAPALSLPPRPAGAETAPIPRRLRARIHLDHLAAHDERTGLRRLARLSNLDRRLRELLREAFRERRRNTGENGFDRHVGVVLLFRQRRRRGIERLDHDTAVIGELEGLDDLQLVDLAIPIGVLARLDRRRLLLCKGGSSRSGEDGEGEGKAQ